MGLDMYLSKKTYFGNQYREPKEQVIVTTPENLKGEIKQKRVSYIIESVAYWRKANQIHNWLVNNVQSGEDDCKEYYVSREQLKELIDACKKDLKTIKKEGYETENLILQPTSGFFFGSTDVDEYFVQQLEDTIKQLDPLLSEETGDFYYQASW